jgi:hypothetical protein
MTPENEPDRFTEPPDPFTGPLAPPAGTPELEHARAESRNEAIQSGPIQNGPVQNAPLHNAPGQSAPIQSAPGAASGVPVRQSWQGRLLGISFAIFAFEIGLFLVIFPWMGDSWDLNYIQSLGPVLQNVWDEPYFRGAVSGLGFLNIYIAILQVARLFRRSP